MKERGLVAGRRIAMAVCVLFLLFAAVAATALSRPLKVTAADGDATDATPEEEVLVFDDIEDFRTKDNGDGTYTILGAQWMESQYMSRAELNGLGDRALRQLVGRDPETDTTPTYNLMAEVYGEIEVNGNPKPGGIEGGKAKGKRFKIVIPANVSAIEDGAFLVVRHQADMFIGYAGLRSLVKFQLSMSGEEVTEENVDAWIATGEFDEMDFGLPDLVSIEFATNADGSRAMQGDGFGHTLFGVSGTTEVTLPKELQTYVIDGYVDRSNAGPFSHMLISSFDVEEGLTRIPNGIFYSNMGIKNLVIPEGIVEVGQGAFLDSTAIETIKFPSTLQKVCEEAFTVYSELQSVDVPSVEQWLSMEFELSNPLSNGGALLVDGQPLTELTVNDVENIPDYAFYGSAIESLTLGANVKSIGEAAFMRCTSLATVTLPDNIVIGYRAFEGCTALTELTVPKHVKFGSYSFDDCTNLQSIYTDSLSDWCEHTFAFTDSFAQDENGRWIYYDNAASNPLSNGGHLYVRSNARTYEEVTDIVIPLGVTKIPANAFVGKHFTSLAIHSAVEEIGNAAFKGCSNITSVSLPESVKRIGRQAFAGTGITEIAVPDSVISMREQVFMDSKSLVSVRLSRNLTELESTFSGCSALKTVNMDFVREIRGSTFKDCTSLEEIDLSRITKMDDGNGSFNLQGCTALKRVVLPENITTMSLSFGNCSALETVVLPKKLERLNTYLFQSCTNLKTVYLPENVSSYGTNLFNRCNDVTVISTNRAAYDRDLAGLGAQLTDRIVLTYPVQVKFMSGGRTVATEQYYYKDAYTGTLPSLAAAWYATEDGTDAIDAAWLTTQLSAADAGDVITVYAQELTTKLFTAKSGLTYDGKIYEGTGVNALLTADSDQITADMTVRIVGYNDVAGEPAVDLPLYIQDAGTYRLRVSGADFEPVDFELTVAPQAIDLADYDNNLGWMLTKIGDENTLGTLMGGRLYVYMKEGGASIATTAPVDTTQGEYAGYMLYSARDVERSIARKRDEAVTIGLVGSAAGVAYSFTIGGTVTATEVGMYTAQATLTPNKNYVLRVGTTEKLNERGLRFTPSENGTYIVEKVWYIVDMGNYAVDGEDSDKDYAIAGGWLFGQAPTATVPYIKFGDVQADRFGSADDPVTLTLTLGATQIGTTFTRADWDEYFNVSMPAGRYTLSITVRPVTFDGVQYPQVTRPYTFTVDAAALPEEQLTALHGVLRNKAFTFDYDGEMHVLNAAAVAAVEALRAAVVQATPTREGVWSGAAYNDYYGGFNAVYNLDRMHSNTYYAVNQLNDENDKPVNPDRYTVYYLVQAKNFASVVEGAADYDAARRAYVFTVTIVREIAIPTAASVQYNGVNQKADIPSSAFYTVDAYDGFADAGTHSVTLTLVNPEYYRWAGKTLGEATATVEFTIQKALNEFIEAPDVVRWVEGKFNEEENGFIGAAKFGTIAYVITDTDDNVIFDLSQGIDNRASMKAGTYILKATVLGNDNYNGLTESFTIRILEKVGMPWWGTFLIVVGALLVVAAVLFILWKKGVIRLLSDKLILAIRTKATVDATIAAIRANKRAEEAKLTVARAKAQEASEARRAAAAAERAKPAEERAAALEEKAQQAAERAQRMAARAEAMRVRAESLRARAADNEKAIDEAMSEVAADENAGKEE